jgi:hypothetical protein
MFKWLDQWIEEKIKSKLHGQRDALLTDALTEFKNAHPQGNDIEYTEKIDVEIDRVYSFIDKSILHAQIITANQTFWPTALLLTLVAVGTAFQLNTLSSHLWLTLLTPTLAAATRWAISIRTIPTTYIQRIEGAMHSTLVAYSHQKNKTLGTHTQDIQAALTLPTLTNNARAMRADESKEPETRPMTSPATQTQQAIRSTIWASATEMALIQVASAAEQTPTLVRRMSE